MAIYHPTPGGFAFYTVRGELSHGKTFRSATARRSRTWWALTSVGFLSEEETEQIPVTRYIIRRDMWPALLRICEVRSVQLERVDDITEVHRRCQAVVAQSRKMLHQESADVPSVYGRSQRAPIGELAITADA